MLSTLQLPCITAHVLQEELLLSGLIAAVISVLLLSLRPGNACDYVYAALFLTCTSSVLRLRWLVGTLSLAAPVLLAAATNLRLRTPGGTAESAAVCLAAGDSTGAACPAAAPGAAVAALGPMQFVVVGPLQLEALVHILVAWAVGALMAYVSGEHSAQARLHVPAWASRSASRLCNDVDLLHAAAAYPAGALLLHMRSWCRALRLTAWLSPLPPQTPTAATRL